MSLGAPLLPYGSDEVTLKDAISADLLKQFDTDEHAQVVTYAGNDISAIVNFEKDLDERPGGKFVGAMMVVKVSDVANPAYRDQVVIGSDTWQVQNVESGDGYVWVLKLEREHRPSMRA